MDAQPPTLWNSCCKSGRLAEHTANSILNHWRAAWCVGIAPWLAATCALAASPPQYDGDAPANPGPRAQLSGTLNPMAVRAAMRTFALAWGVNHGLLDRATCLPVIAEAWRGLIGQIYADGRAAPARYPPSSSYNYGVGAFLLAGAQIADLLTQR